MEWMYVGIVAFLFLLAAFDLWVGVSNDAVNFMNSAIGSKVAKFRTIVTVAAIGVFFGATLSDGMMDIARHGIFRPEEFVFGEVMIIFLAVMVTDVVLLDIFNTLGMPTSTTVSMVFELLGASFAFSMIKIASDSGTSDFGDYLNTDKALEVIMAIFVSVAIAFVVGSLIQYLARLVFTFNFKSKLKWKIGIFGGLGITAILYFMILKGLKHMAGIPQEALDFVNQHEGWVLLGSFVFFTLLMQLLYVLKVNVFRVIVLAGTFALATAFAGNDLVNFIGVPLAGWSSFLDFSASGATDPMAFTMDSLNESAQTPFYFLFAAGAIMVCALVLSKKAHNVTKTEVSLAHQGDGEELFGSSRVARSLVRWGNNVGQFLSNVTPEPVARFIDKRFAPPAEANENGASFDQVRASVNLIVSAMLIALGTSLKLPLSTTYVTFMVAMGTSLADRAWSRESAVFRITGVLTVIGGWFITAGVAFTACFFVALAMYYGGAVAILIIVAIGVYGLIHSQKRFRKKMQTEEGDLLFTQMMECKEQKDIVPMLTRHLDVHMGECLGRYAATLRDTTDALFEESLHRLRKNDIALHKNKRELKNLRRREVVALRRADASEVVRLITTFHLVHNSLQQMLYGLLRISEPAREHVDNHFTPIPEAKVERYVPLRNRLALLMEEGSRNLEAMRVTDNAAVIDQLKELHEEFSAFRKEIIIEIQTSDENLTAMTLLLHIVQETEQLLVETRLLLRSCCKFHELA